jgi:dolichol-phosphate mannosyltransferase
MDLSIIIPCYNEADNVTKLKKELQPVINELSRTNSIEIIFVDDGSTDDTLSKLKTHFNSDSLKHTCLIFEKHETNKGLGAALRTGFYAAQGDSVVTTDSDGTYKFTNIPELLYQLNEGVDIVTASPYHPQGGVAGVPEYRLILSRGSSMIYRLLVDWNIHTYTCLFRAYRREVIEKIIFNSDGFLAGTELMVKGMLSGYHVTEFPAVLYARVHGYSKAKIYQTILAHLKFQARILLHRLRIIPLA